MHWSAAECYERLDEVARAYATSIEESWRDRARDPEGLKTFSVMKSEKIHPDLPWIASKIMAPDDCRQEMRTAWNGRASYGLLPEHRRVSG